MTAREENISVNVVKRREKVNYIYPQLMDYTSDIGKR